MAKLAGLSDVYVYVTRIFNLMALLTKLYDYNMNKYFDII